VVAPTDGTCHVLAPVAVPQAEGLALADWVRRERATRTIEIGFGYAISTLHICHALLDVGEPEAHHVAIDPYQRTRFGNSGLAVVLDAGVADLLELHPEESQIVLPRLLEEQQRFDLAFVDGDHRFDRLFVDLAYLRRLVSPGGIVFVDDHQLPATARAVSFFRRNLEWTVEELSPPDPDHQWAVLRTPERPDTRPWDFFVDF
jgi:predicted O-methyltransferase YrrM